MMDDLDRALKRDYEPMLQDYFMFALGPFGGDTSRRVGRQMGDAVVNVLPGRGLDVALVRLRVSLRYELPRRWAHFRVFLCGGYVE